MIEESVNCAFCVYRGEVSSFQFFLVFAIIKSERNKNT